MPYRPVLLVIMDGWGISSNIEGNAILKAKKPCLDRIMRQFPKTELQASGEYVGLPEGQMGNSEVGHLNIGAGRVVYQELTRINRAIRTREIFANEVLLKAIKKALDHGSAFHLMGLVSDGGVHSHVEHLFALLDMLQKNGLPKIYIHAFLDGRDVPPSSGGEYIRLLEKHIQNMPEVKIASVAGRYYPMDRDKRWDRVEKAYRAIVAGEGRVAFSASEAVERAYAEGQTDEFIEPTVIVDNSGQPSGKIGREDVLLFFNFRADRARQISHAFCDDDFRGFDRPEGFLQLHYVCLTQYDIKLGCPVVYPPQNLNNTLGEMVSAAGLKQMRIAETEKYAHVTFFFNGGIEKAYPGEDRVLIPSPKVATYDLKPQMSAIELTEKVIETINSDRYELIVLNYANPDMVGHTGVFEAAVEAVETVDFCVHRIIDPVLEKGGAIIITADHGNVECMLDLQSRQCVTSHTPNPVPMVLISPDAGKFELHPGGSLQDIAPTILELMGLEKPAEMTGKSLIKPKKNN